MTFVDDAIAKTGRKTLENKVQKNIRTANAAVKSTVKRPLVYQDTRNGHVVPVVETPPFMSRKVLGSGQPKNTMYSKYTLSDS